MKNFLTASGRETRHFACASQVQNFPKIHSCDLEKLIRDPAYKPAVS